MFEHAVVIGRADGKIRGVPRASGLSATNCKRVRSQACGLDVSLWG
jgi:hypothetical protein